MTQNRRNTILSDRRIITAYKLIWILATINLVLFGVFSYQFFGVANPAPGASAGIGSLYLLGVVTTLLTFASLGLGVYAVIHSHRLLGAAYRIQTSLRQVSEACKAENKDIPTVRLREGDQLEPLAKELNDLVHALSSQR